jgi:hypothetical protein
VYDLLDFPSAIAFAYVLAGAFGAKMRANADWTRFARPTNADLDEFIANLVLWPFWSLRAYGIAWIFEPIPEVGIHEQGDGLVKRRSMRRIMARRMKASTVRA